MARTKYQKPSVKKINGKEVAPGLGYEKIVAGIYRQFAEAAEVTENERIIGISGSSRQIDIALREKIDGTTVLVIIECKDYSRPVDIERVDALIGKIQDVEAKRGIIVSDSGFTAGARRRAEADGRVEVASVIDTQNDSLRSRLHISTSVTFYEITSQHFSLSGRYSVASMSARIGDIEAQFHQWYKENVMKLTAGDHSHIMPFVINNGLPGNVVCSFHLAVRHHINEGIYKTGTGILDHNDGPLIGDNELLETHLDFNSIRTHWREASEEEADACQRCYSVMSMPGVKVGFRMLARTKPTLNIFE